MKRTLCCLALFAAAACSQSPTAPTLTEQSIASELRWTPMSASCAPVVPPSPEPSFSTARLLQETDGSVTASWPWTSASGRGGTLYAKFVRENGRWAMCSWDVADV